MIKTHKDGTIYRLEKRRASVTMPHMNSRLFPAALAVIGIACVAIALSAARYSVAIAQYAL